METRKNKKPFFFKEEFFETEDEFKKAIEKYMQSEMTCQDIFGMFEKIARTIYANIYMTGTKIKGIQLSYIEEKLREESLRLFFYKEKDNDKKN